MKIDDIIHWRTATLRLMRRMEGFVEHESEIVEVYSAMPIQGGLEGEIAALYRAYTQITGKAAQKAGTENTADAAFLKSLGIAP